MASGGIHGRHPCDKLLLFFVTSIRKKLCTDVRYNMTHTLDRLKLKPDINVYLQMWFHTSSLGQSALVCPTVRTYVRTYVRPYIPKCCIACTSKVFQLDSWNFTEMLASICSCAPVVSRLDWFGTYRVIAPDVVKIGRFCDKAECGGISVLWTHFYFFFISLRNLEDFYTYTSLSLAIFTTHYLS